MLFIVSLPYSGSTILNIILGESKNIISLGEIGNALLANKLPDYCTCESPTQDCPVWGDLYRGAINENLSLREKYEALIEIVQGLESNNIICDSYKTILEFPDVLNSEQIDPYFIFLSKDIRNWVFSAPKKNSYKINRLKIPYLFKVLYFSLYWTLKNIKFHRQLKKHNFKFIHLGYEELCLNTNQSISNLSQFINQPIELSSSDEIKKLKTNHVLVGNRIRFDSSKNKSLSYQHNWLKSSSIFLLLTYPFLFLNKRFVYSNGKTNTKII